MMSQFTMTEDQQFSRYRIIQRHAGNIEPGGFRGIQYEIFDPSTPGSMLKIHLKKGQQVRAAPGCMVAASKTVHIEGKAKFTLRAFIGAENRTSQVMTAVDADGWVILAPSYMGSIMAVPINGQEMCIADGAFLAGIGQLESTGVLQPFPQAMLSRSAQGFWVKQVSGNGIAFVCSIGTMSRFDLDREQKMIVRNGHMVLWPKRMSNKMKMSNNNWISAYLAGQGVVNEMKGPGFVYIQTRNPTGFSSWVAAHGPSDGGDDGGSAGSGGS